MLGINDNQLRERMLREDIDDLEKIIETCKAAELARTQMSSLQNPRQEPPAAAGSLTASLRTNQTDVNRRHADSVGVGTLHANARLMGKHAAIAEGAITPPACADREDQLERVEPKPMTLRKMSTRSTWEPLKLTR